VCDHESVRTRGFTGALCAMTAAATLVAVPAVALAAPPPATAHVTRLGHASASRTLTLELPLRIDSTGLARFATDVSMPGS
jgi:hypothetical protein